MLSTLIRHLGYEPVEPISRRIEKELSLFLMKNQIRLIETPKQWHELEDMEGGIYFHYPGEQVGVNYSSSNIHHTCRHELGHKFDFRPVDTAWYCYPAGVLFRLGEEYFTYAPDFRFAPKYESVESFWGLRE